MTVVQVTNAGMLCRWRKNKREQLATQEYFEHFRREQALPDQGIVVHRGLGGDEFAMEAMSKGSLKGSILQRISLASKGSRTKIPTSPVIDTKGLLSNDDTDDCSPSSGDELQEITNIRESTPF